MRCSIAPTIAVVDDDVQFRGYMATLLAAEGFQPVAFPNGTTAFHRLRAAPPDLAIVDYLLPDFDGLQLIELLRRHPVTRSLPVVLTTALGVSYLGPLLRAAAQLKAEVLLKPFEAETAVTMIRGLLSLTAVASNTNNVIV